MALDNLNYPIEICCCYVVVVAVVGKISRNSLYIWRRSIRTMENLIWNACNLCSYTHTRRFCSIVACSDLFFFVLCRHIERLEANVVVVVWFTFCPIVVVVVIVWFGSTRQFNGIQSTNEWNCQNFPRLLAARRIRQTAIAWAENRCECHVFSHCPEKRQKSKLCELSNCHSTLFSELFFSSFYLAPLLHCLISFYFPFCFDSSSIFNFISNNSWTKKKWSEWNQIDIVEISFFQPIEIQFSSCEWQYFDAILMKAFQLYN